MAAAAIGATVAVMLCVFAALTISVVRVRRPIDGRIARSFRAVAPRIGSFTRVARSDGCKKTSVDWYDCKVQVSPRRAPGREIIHYRLLRAEDGCWIGEVVFPADAQNRFPTLRGCESGA